MRQPSIENQRLKVAKLKEQVSKLSVKQVQLEEAEAVLSKLTSSESIEARLSRLEELKADQVKLEADIETAKANAVDDVSTDTDTDETSDSE